MKHALKGSMGIVVTLKSKMVASSASCGGIVKVQDLELDPKSNKLPKLLLDSPATSEHMSALPPFKFRASWKYNTIMDLFVTTTPTIHVQATEALFDVTMQKVYFHGN